MHDPTAVEACLRACRFGKVLEAQRTELFLLEYEKGELVTAPHFEERLFQVVVHGSLVIYFIRDDGARYSLSSGEADYILGDMDLFLPSTGSIYTEAAEPLLCLALSLDQNREALLESNSFLRLICGSLTAKMAAITALDAAPVSLMDRVLPYMRFKCQGGVLWSLERESFSLRCSVRRLQRIITSWLRRARSFRPAKSAHRLLP